ncbi:7437_t:CDS:2 [Dentiscutata heterogama]|uniref:7437_t:CDS:1 n=1 Tax=Dentiscutata heterogama TaxID=1316150 RepID=A0ACA9KG66_9GLOM|nr:7437_t:CDS:2 [Dentiscutata heterogama]
MADDNITLTSPISIPQNSVEVIDADEEVFHLYTEGCPLEWQYNPIISQKDAYIDVMIDDQLIIKIAQNQSLLSVSGTTGTVLWNSSIMLSKFMFAYRKWLNLSIDKTNILELGSGCGLTGISLANTLVKLIALTDQATMLPHLWKNVKRNLNSDLISSKVLVAELVWGEEIDKDILSQHWDYIIASDCIYNEFIVGAFVETLAKLCNNDKFVKRIHGESVQDDERIKEVKPTIVIIAVQLRSDIVHLEFLKEMKRRNFIMWRLPNSMLGSDFEKGFVIYIAWTKNLL